MISWKLGRVLWFDNDTGEGVVLDERGNSFYLHRAAIQGGKKQNSKAQLKDNEKVKFTTYENSYLIQVDRIKAA